MDRNMRGVGEKSKTKEVLQIVEDECGLAETKLKASKNWEWERSGLSNQVCVRK